MKNILGFAKKFWLLLLIIGGVIIFAVYQYQKTQAQSQQLVTQRPQIQDLTQTLELTGEIDASQRADLRFVAPSRLSWVGVKEGEYVRKWQAIASVDTRTLQKQLQQDLNNFNKAYREHDQVLDDNNYYGNPDINQELKRVLENSNFDLNNAVINVEIRDLAIRLSSIYTPFDGLVTRVDQPNAGVNVSVTDIFQVINPNTLYFSAEVDELDVSKIAIGQQAIIVLDAYEEETINSTITRIGFSPVAGSSSGTSYKVELAIPGDNIALKYKLGMSGDASIILAQKQKVLTIPANALIERDDKYFVDLKIGEEPERKEVEIGLETDDYVEITNGLTESDEVVIP